MNKPDYEKSRKEAAAFMECWAEQSCIEFAKTLQRLESYVRHLAYVGEESRIPEVPACIEYLNACYRLMTFGPLKVKADMLLGGKPDTERIVRRAIADGGFTDASGRWMDL